MKLALNIIDWHASAPGLDSVNDWKAWANIPARIEQDAPLPACTQLPMMTARRLQPGSRLAVNAGLTLLQRQQVDAIVFSSRHGELERNYKILSAIAAQQTPSPTDFAMSVHNAAVGNLTIVGKAPLVSSSVSAGIDTFQQALIEVATLHQAGYQHVLLVDFDGSIPSFYEGDIPRQMPCYPWALALLLTPGKTLSCQMTAVTTADEPDMPQALQFLHGWLSDAGQFTIDGACRRWQWSCQ
jgi:hypothetical protein